MSRFTEYRTRNRFLRLAFAINSNPLGRNSDRKVINVKEKLYNWKYDSFSKEHLDTLVSLLATRNDEASRICLSEMFGHKVAKKISSDVLFFALTQLAKNNTEWSNDALTFAIEADALNELSSKDLVSIVKRISMLDVMPNRSTLLARAVDKGILARLQPDDVFDIFKDGPRSQYDEVRIAYAHHGDKIEAAMNRVSKKAIASSAQTAAMQATQESFNYLEYLISSTEDILLTPPLSIRVLDACESIIENNLATTMAKKGYFDTRDAFGPLLSQRTVSATEVLNIVISRGVEVMNIDDIVALTMNVEGPENEIISDEAIQTLSQRYKDNHERISYGAVELITLDTQASRVAVRELLPETAVTIERQRISMRKAQNRHNQVFLLVDVMDLDTFSEFSFGGSQAVIFDKLSSAILATQPEANIPEGVSLHSEISKIINNFLDGINVTEVQSVALSD